ncbi:MAG: hypothetical protein GF329_07415 [Candidatus Lokiarchaeota archaeon]|nr:hypothetical protein [Candidatus Lokiarchaeota archaeon]
MLFNLFIIEFGSGKILFEKSFAELAKDSHLFSGMVSTLNLLAREIHIGELSNFSTNEFNFIISASEKIMVVLIVDSNENMKEANKIAYEINKRFQKRYSPINSNSGRSSTYYEDFYMEIEPLLSKTQDNNLLDVGLFLRDIIGGDLHVLTSIYFDFVLDLGAKELFHDFRNLIFVKILDQGKELNQIEESLKYARDLELLSDFCEVNTNLLNYFPSKIIFITENTSDEVISKLKTSNNYDKNGFLIRCKRIDSDIKDLTFFKCKIEMWKMSQNEFEILI